nr:DELTA-thalatoxin-Avl1a-like [Monopterus albus]XP_020460304.1 DELTA-thalatoxin-Avl1a-like [Monopterus albus]
MPQSAESHCETISTNRNCTIEITNVSSVYCLVNPKVHMESGFAFSPPQPTVRATMTELCSFTKDDNTASGAVGVLTYELFDMRNRSGTELMAVMFSVPFDYNLYKNWLGVGIFEHNTACDKKLFELMYNSKDFTKFVRQQANGSGLKYSGKVVDVRASMSDEGKAIIKLELYDKMGR